MAWPAFAAAAASPNGRSELRETQITELNSRREAMLTAIDGHAFMLTNSEWDVSYRPESGNMVIVAYRHQAGFSLIELMITLVVLAILVAAGVPSFNQLRLNSRTAALAGDISSALNLARSEAVTRSEQVNVCPSNDSTSCSGAWTDGWIVIVNASSEVLRAYPTPDVGATITQTPAANTSIGFGALGQPLAGSTQLFTQVNGCQGERARQIEAAAAGRVSVSRVPCV